METPELDRLEDGVKRALGRIETLTQERNRLSAEKADLESRLKERMNAKPNIASDGDGAFISSSKLKELKTRLATLIAKIEALEAKL